MAARKKSSTKKKSVARKPRAKPSQAPKRGIEARLAALDAKKSLRKPKFPVATALDEGSRLHRLGMTVRARLVALKAFELHFLDELPQYCRLLEEQEAAWLKARAADKAAERRSLVSDAEAMRRELVASARYLLRHDATVQQRLDQVEQKEGQLDLAEDLRILAGLVDEFPKVFAADDVLPRDAADQARALAERIVERVIVRSTGGASFDRNKAFWLVAQANGEVRAALTFLFRKDPERLAELGRSYVAEAQLRSRRAQKVKGKPPAKDATPTT